MQSCYAAVALHCVMLVFVYFQEFTKRDLLSNEIVLEEFGGTVQAVEISAQKVS